MTQLYRLFMANMIGQCVPLDNDGDLIFCEILSYQSSGYYYVSLTRGLVNKHSKRFPAISTLHESIIEELTVSID